MSLKYDYHTHPQGHSVRPYTIAMLQPWIDQCKAKNVTSIAFTDHDRYHAGIDFEVVEQLRDMNPKVEILVGIELDNDPVTSGEGLRWVEKHWDKLDFVLGSVHYFQDEQLMFDRADQALQTISRGVEKAYEQYLNELEKIVARGQIDCLSHLDLIKIHGFRPEVYEGAAFFRPILDFAKKGGLAIEASTAGWRKTVGEQYPDFSIISAAAAAGVPITTASDAHSPAQLAEDFDRLAQVLEEVGVKKIARYRSHQLS